MFHLIQHEYNLDGLHVLVMNTYIAIHIKDYLKELTKDGFSPGLKRKYCRKMGLLNHQVQQRMRRYRSEENKDNDAVWGSTYGLWDVDGIVIPVHEELHFYTLYLEMYQGPGANQADPSVRLWDSAKKKKLIPWKRIKMFEDFFRVICCLRPGGNTFARQREWADFKPIVEIYQQKQGSSNCGVAACLFAQFGPRDLPLTFNDDQVANARMRMVFILGNLSHFRPSRSDSPEVKTSEPDFGQ